MSDEISTEVLRIPNEMVGKVVGRSGAMIRQLQEDSGCRIILAISSNGEQTRKVTLQGEVERRRLARELINQLVASDFEFLIPEKKVGLLIGKKGETIKMIQEVTETDIYIGNMEHSGQRQVKISGLKPSVEAASKKILEILNQEFVCGICMEVVLEKPGDHARFGILPSCNHCFCLSCITKWRKAKYDDEITKSCPECRVEQQFVIPSKVWMENPTSKKELVENFTDNATRKDCRFFTQNFGNCPNGSKCIYNHDVNSALGRQMKSVKIPGNIVGFIIGKGGERIKNLQVETNTKMMVMQDNTELLGEKELRIIGTEMAVKEAAMKVELMIMEVSLKNLRSSLRTLTI